MKLHGRSLTPHITVDHEARRPVLLRLGGLVLAMSTTEAQQIADQLHDAVEEADQ